MIHGLYRFGPKMLAVVSKIECTNCNTRRTVMATVAEMDLPAFLEFSQKRLAERIGPCKTENGRHKWIANVLAQRSLAGSCMCEQCWPPPADSRSAE
jgi:fructose/tagatose bisphosphate aldolase